MASLAALLTSVLLATGAQVAEAKAPYCLPGNPCFPASKVLDTFNASVGGRLIKSEPYGAACYKATYDAEKCKEVAKNKSLPEWRAKQPAAVQFSNFEQNDKLEGCIVPDLKKDGSAPDPIDGKCTLGGMSHYVVNATSADDIAKSVQFAAKYNLRFRVKNSGHCYTGRSSGEGSFSVWTHYMNDAKFIKNFVPAGSRSAPHDVISAGPGVNVLDLYEAGAKNGVVTIGGFSPTVGAAGGYVLGGGTGPFGPHFGLGVDNVVQYEVITADGQKKIANSAVNPDLFWALRGGGGTFAVTTRVYLKAYPMFETINTIAGGIVCKDQSAYEKIIDEMVELQLPLRAANQTGIWETNPATKSVAVLSFEMFTTKGSEKPADDALKLFSPVLTIPGCDPHVRGFQTKGTNSWLDIYNKVVTPLAQEGGAVGLTLADLSRTISYDMVNDRAQRDKIKKFILEVPAPFIWQNAVGGVVQNVAPDATAVHPDWRKAFAFMDTPIFGAWDGLTPQVHQFINETSKLMTETFGSSVYYNEQYATGEEWQKGQFGSNYPRLLRIKKAVDPKGLFNCRNCVGSENGY